MEFLVKRRNCPRLSHSLSRASLPLSSGFRDGWNSRPHFGRPRPRPATKVDGAGTKMTGPPSSSYPSWVSPPAAGIPPENRRKQPGFARNFTGFVLRRPATDSGKLSSSIYELKFVRFCDRDSGHLRSVFGVGVLAHDLEVFRRCDIALDTHALPARVAARGHCS
ncbi:unnamed protein product [Prunus armeniaca]